MIGDWSLQAASLEVLHMPMPTRGPAWKVARKLGPLVKAEPLDTVQVNFTSCRFRARACSDPCSAY